MGKKRRNEKTKNKLVFDDLIMKQHVEKDKTSLKNATFLRDER